MRWQQILQVFLCCCRFFGNRSYCYCCLEQYPQALADAQRAIELAPDWPKGYFRQGSALIGMKVSACVHACRPRLAAHIWFVCFSGTVRRNGPWSRCWNWTRTVRRPLWTWWTAECCSSWWVFLQAKVFPVQLASSGCWWAGLPLIFPVLKQTPREITCVSGTFGGCLSLLWSGTWFRKRPKCLAAREVFHCACCPGSVLRCCQGWAHTFPIWRVNASSISNMAAVMCVCNGMELVCVCVFKELFLSCSWRSRSVSCATRVGGWIPFMLSFPLNSMLCFFWFVFCCVNGGDVCVAFRSPCRSLWVGNVTTELTENHLRELFKVYKHEATHIAGGKRALSLTASELLAFCRRCGDIESIRVLHERFCAFVNFKSEDMAAHAMEKLNVSDTSLSGFLSFLVQHWCNINVFLADCLDPETPVQLASHVLPVFHRVIAFKTLV